MEQQVGGEPAPAPGEEQVGIGENVAAEEVIAALPCEEDLLPLLTHPGEDRGPEIGEAVEARILLVGAQAGLSAQGPVVVLRHRHRRQAEPLGNCQRPRGLVHLRQLRRRAVECGQPQTR
ncbi:MAG TPA: hypothetical protein VEG34_07510 [Thermoanaerobaculia bacterium]|nr:hypothetical protein [Thermoanaerobaculia bacterium]